MKATTLEDVQALAQSMVSSPASAVQLAGQLQATIRHLPVPRSELITRPQFDRAALWTYSASFENLDNNGEPSTQVLELQRDVWVRGVTACVILQQPAEEIDELTGLSSITLGSNLRWLVDLNWTIDDERGFITTGLSEILASALAVTGDGEYAAPLDWRLQRNQTIVVRARSRAAQYLPEQTEEDPPAIVRWLAVNFWCEELRHPGV